LSTRSSPAPSGQDGRGQNADIVGYIRFADYCAGVTIDDWEISALTSGNVQLYGPPYTTEDIVRGAGFFHVPRAGRRFREALTAYFRHMSWRMTTFLHRLSGAALLKAEIYEEVEADRSATLQAMSVVLLSSLAAGIGLLGTANMRLMTLAGICLLAFAVWAVWAALTFQIGTRLIPAPRTQADVGQLLRTKDSRRRQAYVALREPSRARDVACSS
jgi:hypothetical protein